MTIREVASVVLAASALALALHSFAAPTWRNMFISAFTLCALFAMGLGTLLFMW